MRLKAGCCLGRSALPWPPTSSAPGWHQAIPASTGGLQRRPFFTSTSLQSTKQSRRTVLHDLNVTRTDDPPCNSNIIWVANMAVGFADENDQTTPHPSHENPPAIAELDGLVAVAAHAVVEPAAPAPPFARLRRQLSSCLSYESRVWSAFGFRPSRRRLLANPTCGKNLTLNLIGLSRLFRGGCRDNCADGILGIRFGYSRSKPTWSSWPRIAGAFARRHRIPPCPK